MNAVPDGLPGALPEGEQVLWQGRPDWQLLARRAFHIRKIAAYFGLLLVWYGVTSFGAAADGRQAALATARMAGIALVPLALILAYAWVSSRSTTYTLTNRRLVMTVGIALPMTINLPFNRIASAAATTAADGSGSVVVTVLPPDRLAYLALWPHARPWRMARPEPMLRCLPDAAPVAQMLARALAQSAGMAVQATDFPTAVADRARAPVSAIA